MEKRQIEVSSKNNSISTKIKVVGLYDENKLVYFDKTKVELELINNNINIIRTLSEDEKIFINLCESPKCKYLSPKGELFLNIKVIEKYYDENIVKIKYMIEETENIEIEIKIGEKI